ncbi:flavin-containing monooxygenase [Roseiflexus sp.]|uniref:flavin-containing monooxygenase n=1 Tax=Roseiflexus sp. TaxID=2562120 RepID=UPI00398A8D58
MIVIVGAGPAGLAMAAELARRNLPHRIIERGQVGESWHHHYDRLRLHTLKQVSALPYLPMPPDYPNFPSRAQVLAYLQHYARNFDLRIDEGIDLRRADFVEGRWILTTSNGQTDASVLVMATGIWSAPARPRLPGEERFGGPILHSRDYRNPEPFCGQRVLVVGAGNSGAEIAVDLAEYGVETSIVVRSGVACVPRPRSASAMRAIAWLLRTLPAPLAARLLRRRDFRHVGLPLPPGSPLTHYPVVGYELPQAVAAGHITVYPGIEQLERGAVSFRDGRRAPFDAIILATGYRPALDPVAHLIDCDARGRPLLDRHWRSLSNPQLVCIGYTYPTTEGWLQAIGRVVRAAAQGVAAMFDVQAAGDREYSR